MREGSTCAGQTCLEWNSWIPLEATAYFKTHCNNRPSSIQSASALEVLVSAMVVIHNTSAKVEPLHYWDDTWRHQSMIGPYMNVDTLGKEQLTLPNFYNSSSNFILEVTCKW